MIRIPPDASRVGRWLAVAGVIATLSTQANANGLVVYLSDYLTGDYYFAPLPELAADGDLQSHIQPVKLSLPGDFRRSVELGNHDISRDGTEIVFAARTKRRQEWDIYTGRTDFINGRITDLARPVSTRGVRDEDPRFDWSRDTNGSHRIVYKCGGDVCVYANGTASKVIEDPDCELWAPSFNSEGSAISYARRCGDGATDRIWIAHLNAPESREQVPLPDGAGGPDRFAHFENSETLIYSHIMADTGAASLWRYHPPTGQFERLTFNTNTNSDDDAYPDKTNPQRIAYIGWQEGSGYSLFVHQDGVSHKLSHGVPILAPAIFQLETFPEPPPPPPGVTGVHIASLAAVTGTSGGRWWSQVEASLQDSEGLPVAGVTVTLATDAGDAVSCEADAQGACTTERLFSGKKTISVTYLVSAVDHAGYDARLNRMETVTAIRP